MYYFYLNKIIYYCIYISFLAFIYAFKVQNLLKYLNLFLADNDELRQGVMQPETMFRDVLFKYAMDFALPSQNQKRENMLSGNPKNNEQTLATSSNAVSNSLNDHKFTESNVDFISAEETKVDEINSQNSEVPFNESTLYFLPVNYNKRNPWRRTIGLHIYGHVCSSAENYYFQFKVASIVIAFYESCIFRYSVIN